MSWFKLKFTPKRWSRQWWLYHFWPPSRSKIDAWLRLAQEILARNFDAA